MAPPRPPSSSSQTPSPPSSPRGPRRPIAHGLHILRFLAIALPLLGAGLAVGGLFQPWWHFTQTNGQPFANSSDAQPVTPGVTLGLRDGRVQLLLGCAEVAVVAGLVSLFLPKRARGCLAQVAAAAGLAGLALAYVTATFVFVDAAVLTVLDVGYYLYSLGCVLILAGAGALLAVRRPRVSPREPH